MTQSVYVVLPNERYGTMLHNVDPNVCIGNIKFCCIDPRSHLLTSTCLTLTLANDWDQTSDDWDIIMEDVKNTLGCDVGMVDGDALGCGVVDHGHK